MVNPIDHPVFLYVEDDGLSREVMKTLITRVLKYEHLTILPDSSNFAEKLNKLNPVPNVIFLDIHVKPYDGFAMLQMIRENAAFSEAAVVAVTASVMNQEVELLQEAGFDSAISKPISQMLFPDLVAQIMRREFVWFIK